MKRRNLILILIWESRKLFYLQCPELIPEIFWRQAINCQEEENICPSFSLHRTKIFDKKFLNTIFIMSKCRFACLFKSCCHIRPPLLSFCYLHKELRESKCSCVRPVLTFLELLTFKLSSSGPVPGPGQVQVRWGSGSSEIDLSLTLFLVFTHPPPPPTTNFFLGF